MYICGMKENYNHENRHKYYLKCHLIFCIKYRRKILKGEFDDNIKAIFQSIAYNSDFDIDIMETNKDNIHFLISYSPKLSVKNDNINLDDWCVLLGEMVKRNDAKIKKWFPKISAIDFERKIFDECISFLNSGELPYYDLKV